ncbi:MULTISPECIES: indole-3-glycerol-phosphate synthase [Carboxydocella]|uniref:indole-3-glycerol-phosphate synthase n=2 Tax=Carboxydocella TaxID=178898 RepID=A0A1T4RTS3_9FIRM|nr:MULTISPECIES: indole-3-glycerol-phosphate synthase [Carboxydocella]AVX20391.1 indole-3-glycerol phosphate synthase [Carboxydocella thermautotrophica]GAW28097.1 hypothetical protein ULO1_06670 [Carboxydocella sp. ULO1]GAW32474.1 hypothetical protein JDF658_22390 [Carboxydocella sp. JDF658]SKA19380.1 indole-3-glycerol phosphate synthase [Carboxydocella sporoproducens DSM 16521]
MKQAPFLKKILTNVEARWGKASAIYRQEGIRDLPESRPFSAIFATKPALLAEIKLASPSAGPLGLRQEAVERAKAYEQNGAAAISVVTEPEFFQGDLELLTEIKKHVRLPILAKDFILYPAQVYAARKAGADALLLIVRLLDLSTLQRLVACCRQVGIEPVLEIFDERDWGLVQQTDGEIILINNRDLFTLEVDLKRSLHLLPFCQGRKVIAASGINTAEDAKVLLSAGADGLLIGTRLMRSQEPGEVIRKILDCRRE